jgi:putative ABC transport system permease protein
LSDSVSRLYDQESRILKLIASISTIAVLVACLGLFAVASLVTGLRTREVGLRKVFGATATEIVNLLSWQFLKPVLLANLVAWPAAWFYMNNWLQDFVYRIDLNPMLFLFPGVMALIIAWITVASQAWFVARNNPIHALHYE